MKRARHPMPTELHGLKKNTETDLYEITEEGILYGIPYELLPNIKKYFQDNSSHRPTVCEWFARLSRPDRKLVIMEGDIYQGDERDFWPDVVTE